jgi:hypothetical protein
MDRPSRIARNGTRTSSGYTISLLPNPPPTSGATTRTRWGGNSSNSAKTRRTSCGTCDETHTRRSPVACTYSATMPRGSIGIPPPRVIRKRSDRTRADSRSARSTSPLARVTRPTRLSSSPSCTVAPRGGGTSCTEGSGSYSISRPPAASSARAPLGDDRRGSLADEPRLVPRQHRPVSLPKRRVSRSAGQRTTHAPELCEGDDVDHAESESHGVDVDSTDPRMGVGATHQNHVEHPREREIADVGPLAGQEAAVLDAS